MNIMTDNRQKFENWVKTDGVCYGLALDIQSEDDEYPGEYIDATTQLVWDSWQASRESKPDQPSLGLLMSMAIRSDHGLAIPGHYDQPVFQSGTMAGVTHKRRLEVALGSMRQMWEEVTGNGFYSPEKDAGYEKSARNILGADYQHR